MPQTDPNLGLAYGWTLGESGWHTGMDANLKRLGAVVGLAVTSRSTTTPPAFSSWSLMAAGCSALHDVAACAGNAMPVMTGVAHSAGSSTREATSPDACAIAFSRALRSLDTSPSG